MNLYCVGPRFDSQEMLRRPSGPLLRSGTWRSLHARLATLYVALMSATKGILGRKASAACSFGIGRVKSIEMARLGRR